MISSVRFKATSKVISKTIVNKTVKKRIQQRFSSHGEVNDIETSDRNINYEIRT